MKRPQYLGAVREIKDCFKIPILLSFYSNLPRLANLTVACREKENIFCFSIALWISCFGRRWHEQKYIVFLKCVENTKCALQDCCTVKPCRMSQSLGVHGHFLWPVQEGRQWSCPAGRVGLWQGCWLEQCWAGVTVFPGSHPAQPGMAPSAQSKACDPARALQSQPSCYKKNMEHLQFMCHLPFLFPVYTSECHNSGIQCHLLWILLSEEDLSLTKFRIQFKAKLMMTIFAGNIYFCTRLKRTNTY